MRILAFVLLITIAVVCAKPGGGRGLGDPDKTGFGCRGQGCYRTQNMTLTVDNPLKPPYFTHTVTLGLRRYKPLIYYLEQACIQDTDNFKNFTATFHHQWGYFIDAFNGVFSNWPGEQTYWHIDNDDGPLQLGPSSYVPVPNDNIIFTLIYSPLGHDA